MGIVRCSLAVVVGLLLALAPASAQTGAVVAGTIVDAQGGSLPGVLLFWWMARTGLVDSSIGSAGVDGPGDARADG